MRTAKGTGRKPKRSPKQKQSNERETGVKPTSKSGKIEAGGVGEEVAVDPRFFAPGGTVWYEKFASELPPIAAQAPTKGPVKLDTGLILRQKNRAQELYDQLVSSYDSGILCEMLAHVPDFRRRRDADSMWLQSVMRSGTAGDRIAAMIILIQQAPIHKLQVDRLCWLSNASDPLIVASDCE
jgi:hypothetical protein